MKKLLVLASFLVAPAAFAADTTLFTCTVPSATKAITLNIVQGDDQSADFVTLTLKEKTGDSVFFSQADKGTVATQIAAGYYNALVLTDATRQADGAIVNSGFLALAKQADGSFGGFVAAKGNVYPLSCTK